jgi:hypothetical protein
MAFYRTSDRLLIVKEGIPYSPVAVRPESVAEGTMMSWRRHDTGQDSYDQIQWQSAGSVGFYHRRDNTVPMQFNVTTFDGSNYRVAPKSVGVHSAYGSWYHLALTFRIKSGEVGWHFKTYFNGLLIDDWTADLYPPAWTPPAAAASYVKGATGCFKLWTRELSHAEVRDEMLSQRAVHIENLLSDVPLTKEDYIDAWGNGDQLPDHAGGTLRVTQGQVDAVEPNPPIAMGGRPLWQ